MYVSVCMLVCAMESVPVTVAGLCTLEGLAYPGASSWGDQALRGSCWVGWMSKPRHCVCFPLMDLHRITEWFGLQKSLKII